MTLILLESFTGVVRIKPSMTRLALAFALVVAACNSKEGPPSTAPSNASTATASTTGHDSVENALKAFNSALESGDGAKIRAQFPPRAALANHVDARCAEGWDKMFDEWVTELTTAGDAKALKGTQSQFVKLDSADTRSVPAGTEAEGCKFAKPVAFVKTSATWQLEGENHQFALTVVQIDGRYFAFDLPGK